MIENGFLIGRFQVPEPHEGHRFLINRILEQCPNLTILLGSANKASSIKNPYSFKRRKDAINSIYPQIRIYPLNDYTYDDTQWQADVAATIDLVKTSSAKPTLFGFKKQGNHYLEWFPQYDYVNVHSTIETSGTEIRNSFRHMLPPSVVIDYDYFDRERVLFKDYPYKDTLGFMCADAVIECSGHVLLIQRNSSPGKGNWALPGGHKNNTETFQQCFLRELKEETNLRVPDKVILGSIKASRMFDNPNRGCGIPRVTMAYYARIEPDFSGSLPRIRAGDDAGIAMWVPLNEALNSYSLHDDHGDIISQLTRVKPVIAVSNPIYN